MKRTIKFTLFRTRAVTQVDLDREAAYVEEHSNAFYGDDLKLGETMDFEDEIELPAKWDICNRCNGEGHHTNPNIDGNGITAEEWDRDWDEEEREMYMSGGYDVRCEANCEGGKVIVPDDAACENEPFKSLLAAFYELQEDLARDAAEDRRTLYYESGGYEGSRY